MTAHSEKELWKWLTGALFAILLLVASWASGAYHAVDAHASLPGHPTVVAHVEDVARRLARIEKKLDRLIIVSGGDPHGYLVDEPED